MEYNKLVGWHGHVHKSTTSANIQVSDAYTRIFEHVVKTHEPSIILELNASTGHNTLWFAENTTNNTHIYASDSWVSNKLTFFDNLCGHENKITPMHMDVSTSA